MHLVYVNLVARLFGVNKNKVFLRSSIKKVRVNMFLVPIKLGTSKFIIYLI